ncbi:serine O-acetyltransferase [Paenibacillus sp. 481]|nr:serine O-acetyltransferase [Paenibacillus sp. 481]
MRRIIKQMQSDVQAVFDNDPAARSRLEVIFTYSGLHAIWAHRVAHWFYKRKWFAPARLISQVSRFMTGIEIHPGARIGQRLFIDHGMGVVVGETCEIGDDVVIYQGVTLGGTGKEKGKRHPTIGNNVVIASGAKVLGSFQVGEHSNIGANSVVLREVPPHCTVVGIPGRIVKQDGIRIDRLNHGQLPDPVIDMFRSMQTEIDRLKAEMEQMKVDRNNKSTGAGTGTVGALPRIRESSSTSSSNRSTDGAGTESGRSDSFSHSESSGEADDEDSSQRNKVAVKV